MLSFWAFFHFYPLTIQKIEILEKSKKHYKMPSFYWGVPKITIICHCSWDMQCDRHNFLSFWLFLALLPQYWRRKLKSRKNIKNWIYSPFTHVYHNWRSCDVLFLRFKAKKSFLSFWAIFCPLTLLTTWKIEILKKN